MEHTGNLRRLDENSPLYRHWREVHPNLTSPPHFSFHLVKVHKSALDRQLSEALDIARDESKHPMNQKQEFGRNSLVAQTTTYNGEPVRPVQRVQEVQSESPRRKRSKSAIVAHRTLEVSGEEEVQSTMPLSERRTPPVFRNRRPEPRVQSAQSASKSLVQSRLTWNGIKVKDLHRNGR